MPPRQRPQQLQQYPIHPDAEAFPMMGEEELAQLADDIKANGLIYPIMLGKLQVGREEKDAIVDGRNRLKACELAGVEPHFAQLNGIDVKAYIASTNLARRNLSKGQQAIAWALLYPEGGRGGRGRRDANLAESARFSQRRLSEARQIVNHNRDLALQVRDGRPFEDALNEAKRREAGLEDSATRLNNLREHAPDLAEQVEDETLSLNEAVAAMEQRLEDTRNVQRAAVHLLAGVTQLLSGYLDRHSPEQGAEDLMGHINEEFIEEDMDLSAATLKKAGTFLLHCHALRRRSE